LQFGAGAGRLPIQQYARWGLRGVDSLQVDETITIPQFRAMVILSQEGPINLATLARLLGVEPSTTGKMVDRLVNAGLIDRQPHPQSRRDLLVQLTKSGDQIVHRVMEYRRAEIARIVAQMPPRHREGLVDALSAFTTAADEPDTQI
jgi:DNA-binding MarR family transcriptional regulator